MQIKLNSRKTDRSFSIGCTSIAKDTYDWVIEGISQPDCELLIENGFDPFQPNSVLRLPIGNFHEDVEVMYN